MARAPRALRRVAAPFSPARRRWIRFLHALPLEPERLELPVAAPGPRDFIICGSPRSGTTLASAALFQPPSVVTVMEPWDGMRLPPESLFTKLRNELHSTGMLQQGRLDVGALLHDGVARWCLDGESRVPVATDPDSLLGVKWPAYWRYLSLLPETKFIVCLRHPFEVIASYKKAGGRLGEGLEYDTAFNRTQNEALTDATSDPALRRVLLFDYIHDGILEHLDSPNVLPIRYERWFVDRAELLQDIGVFLGRDVNAAPLRLRAPQSSSALSDQDVSLIRKHCRTAEALGYSLDEWPRYQAVEP